MVLRLVFCFALLAATTASLVALVPGPQERSSVWTAVETYPDGEWRRAVSDLVSRRVTAGDLTDKLEQWAAAGGPTAESRRRVLAAAFALDVVWTATRTNRHLGWSMEARGPEGRLRHLDDRSAQGVVASWASRQIPTVGPPSALERLLWLSAIGIAEDGEAWVTLHTEILPAARRRIPDDARVGLATVVAGIYTDLRRRTSTHGVRDRTRVTVRTKTSCVFFCIAEI